MQYCTLLQHLRVFSHYTLSNDISCSSLVEREKQALAMLIECLARHAAKHSELVFSSTPPSKDISVIQTPLRETDMSVIIEVAKWMEDSNSAAYASFLQEHSCAGQKISPPEGLPAMAFLDKCIFCSSGLHSFQLFVSSMAPSILRLLFFPSFLLSSAIWISAVHFLSSKWMFLFFFLHFDHWPWSEIQLLDGVDSVSCPMGHTVGKTVWLCMRASVHIWWECSCLLSLPALILNC